MYINLDQLPSPRRDILHYLKQHGSATVADLSSHLQMTGEAVRQHLLQLTQDKFIQRQSDRTPATGAGRPSLYYSLTVDGEHLFPKHYDGLTVELIDTIIEQLGEDSLKQVLSSMTENWVQRWEYQLRALSLTERVSALKGIYMENDSFIEMEQNKEEILLIERNCPFANVAMKRPILCSVTVNALTKLLGLRVIRKETFQNGDGRCVFSILSNQSIDTKSHTFLLEE
ncbi:helix-turn-helix transcriptional regulator [Lederbergia panacisoli]|uniref:helix-turn-helix transcriptional regulator n=1 Tax=Lederbergia panacisoli TaxID=1255251 RepID=UPI00214CC508|nr:methanogen output domain 1-containing protein [Lederbergia panacisoli]MCR2822764.1 methanogen output domain 1-containing protein [Lederbergia panacisoli]